MAAQGFERLLFAVADGAGAEGRRRALLLLSGAGVGDADMTPRELDCLRWLTAGCGTKEIARRMNVAEATVVFHIRNCCRKLNTNSRIVAAVRAVRLGLVDAA